MKRILAIGLVLLMLLTGCAAPQTTSSNVLEDNSLNDSIVSQVSSSTTTSTNTTSTSSTTTTSSLTSSEDITVVTPPTNVGTENAVSGEKLPASAVPLKTDNWCYYRITEEQQRIYKLLFSAANTMAYGWIDLGNCNAKTYNADIAVAYRAFTHDYPELFWVPYEYVVKKDIKGVKVAFSLRSDGYTQSYLVNLDQRKEMQKEIEAATEKILSEIKGKTKNKMEQLLLLHDKLCENITYYSVKDDNDLVYTIYGAIAKGYAVCEGYAKAMRYLCKQLGIDCLLVTGVSKEEQHMWNLISLDNQWYHFDITWNDTDGVSVPLHTYFNVTDETILKDHTIDPDMTEIYNTDKDMATVGYNISLPAAKGEKYNYYTYFGLNFTDMLYAARKIVSVYETKNFIEFALNDRQLQNYEKDKVAFLSALISNIYLVSDEVDLSEKDVIYTNTGNTLYLEWNEKTQSVN